MDRAPARLQPEVRAPVPDQVELDIAAAAVELELAFALAVGCADAALHDGQVGVQKLASPTARVIAKPPSKPSSEKSS